MSSKYLKLSILKVNPFPSFSKWLLKNDLVCQTCPFGESSHVGPVITWDLSSHWHKGLQRNPSSRTTWRLFISFLNGVCFAASKASFHLFGGTKWSAVLITSFHFINEVQNFILRAATHENKLTIYADRKTMRNALENPRKYPLGAEIPGFENYPANCPPEL